MECKEKGEEEERQRRSHIGRANASSFQVNVDTREGVLCLTSAHLRTPLPAGRPGHGVVVQQRCGPIHQRVLYPQVSTALVRPKILSGESKNKRWVFPGLYLQLVTSLGCEGRGLARLVMLANTCHHVMLLSQGQALALLGSAKRLGHPTL